jgi:pilus assembly protein CpaE
MNYQGNAALTPDPEATQYDVWVVEPDPALRQRLGLRIGGATGIFDSIPALVTRIVGAEGQGRLGVAILGPGLADSEGITRVRALGEAHPELGVVLVADQLSTGLLQHALRAGVRDAISLVDADTSLRAAVARVGTQLLAAGGRFDAREAEDALGRVIVSFSTKGGVGKSMLATNLACGLAQRATRPVAIVDADLQFGDVAVLLGVSPERSVVDAAAALHQGEPEALRPLMVEHPATGLLVLPAPVEPSAADQVTPGQMLMIVETLRRTCEFVVVDMPPHFDDMVLALIEQADEVLVVASMDIPSVKNLKVGMQTLDLLSLAGERVKLVLNRANAKVKLDVSEVERALSLKVSYQVPSDIAVPQSVNRGVPVIVDNPRAPAARALEDIAQQLFGDRETKGHVVEAVPDTELSPRRRRRLRRR